MSKSRQSETIQPENLPHSVVIRYLRRRLWKAFQEEDVKSAKRAYEASRIEFYRWVQEEQDERIRVEEAVRLESLSKGKRHTFTKRINRSNLRNHSTRQSGVANLIADSSTSDFCERDLKAAYADDVPILQTEMNPSEPFIADDFLSPFDSYRYPAMKDFVHKAKPEGRKPGSRRPRLSIAFAGFRRSEQQRGAEERFDEDEVDREGREDFFMTTPLHEAARLGSAELTRYLIKIGGDPNTKNGQLRTAVHMAAGGCSREEYGLLLLSQKKSLLLEKDKLALGIHAPVLPDDILLNPHEESEKPHSGSAKKAVMRMIRSSFRSPFKRQLDTVEENDTDIVKEFDPTRADSLGRERMDAVLAIISWNDQESGEGPSLNAVDKNGRSALHYASELGRSDICMVILSNFGAMLTIVDELGAKTPCELAAEQDHQELAAQLEARALLYVDPYGLDDELMASVIDQSEDEDGKDPRLKLAHPFQWFETISSEQVREERNAHTDRTLQKMRGIIEVMSGIDEAKKVTLSSEDSGGEEGSSESDDDSKEQILVVNQEVTKLLANLRLGHAERLLNHHKWNDQESLKAFQESPLEALATAGAPVSTSPKFNDEEVELEACIESSNSTCLICYDGDVSKEDWITIDGCVHGFCSGCFESYLSDCAASKTTGLAIPCPHHECDAILSISQLSSFLSTSPERSSILESLTLASDEKFVMTSPDYRFCPHPGCTGVVKQNKRGFLSSAKEIDLLVYTGAVCTACVMEIEPNSPLTYEGVQEPEYYNCRSSVQPRRGHRFCFACGEDVHWPVTCRRLEEWHRKLDEEIGTDTDKGTLKADDIAQKLWLKANTRPCPECSVPIEKNEGCNHMTCTNPACCHEFCWICRKDWKLHGTSTGGFFRCNIWQDEDVDESSLTPGEVEPSRSRRGIDEVDGSETDPNNDQGYGTAVHAARMAWRQKYEMARFLHHYTRWEAHKDSASLEKHMADTVCSRLAPVVEAAIDFNGFDDFNFGGKGLSFLHDAFTELLECRSVLQHSYAFSFFRYPSILQARRHSHIQNRRREKRHFQSIQAELEMLTEQMSDIVARSHLRATQNQISFLTLSAAEKRRDFSSLMFSILSDERRENDAVKEKNEKQKHLPSGRRRYTTPGATIDSVRIITQDTLNALRHAREETEEVNEALRASLEEFISHPHALELDDERSGAATVAMWSCTACTFVNSSGSRCAMCNSSRRS